MQIWLLATLEEIINNFSNEYKTLWYENNQQNRLFSKVEFEQYQNKHFKYILQTSIGFAGIEMCRRTCGLAGVKEIREIPEPILKAKAEDMVLSTGIFMVENYLNINSIQDLILKLHNI
jgi:5-methylthioribose kinase